MILRLPSEKAGVGCGLSDISSREKKFGRNKDGTINVAKKMLALRYGTICAFHRR